MSDYSFTLGFACGAIVAAAALFGWAAWRASRDDDDQWSN